MDFTVALSDRRDSFLCRLRFDYDGWLKRKLVRGGTWAAEPGVFNLSRGRFSYHDGFLFPQHGARDPIGPWLHLADADSIGLGIGVPGWKTVLTLVDFPSRPRSGSTGTARVGKYGANRTVGGEHEWLRWRVRSVDGDVYLLSGLSR